MSAKHAMPEHRSFVDLTPQGWKPKCVCGWSGEPVPVSTATTWVRASREAEEIALERGEAHEDEERLLT